MNSAARQEDAECTAEPQLDVKPLPLVKTTTSVPDATSGPPSIGVPAAMPTWAPSLEVVEVHTLVDHPAWRELLGSEPPELEEDLTDQLRDPTMTPQIVIVTGERCASPPNTMLDGHRYIHALQTIAPTKDRQALVARRTDLSADAEQLIMIGHALRSQHARRLKLSQIAALEGRLFEIHSRGRGFRSDTTCVDVNASSGGRRLDALSAVARDSGEPRNAVANRRKVFMSVLGHRALHDAVDTAGISLSVGADIVRGIEKDPSVAEVLRRAHDEQWDDETIMQDATIQAARSKVEEKVRAAMNKPPKKKPSNEPEKLEKVEQAGTMDGGSLVMTCAFRGRRTRVTVLEKHVVRLEDLGKEIRKKTAPEAPK